MGALSHTNVLTTASVSYIIQAQTLLESGENTEHRVYKLYHAMHLDKLVVCQHNNILNSQLCTREILSVQILLLSGSQHTSLLTSAVNQQNSLKIVVITGNTPLHFTGSEVKSQCRNYLT
jgi:hypothetical protein